MPTKMPEAQATYELQDRIQDLEAIVSKLRAVLEDGCVLGLAPDECREALARILPKGDGE